MTRLIAASLLWALSCPALDIAWADANRVLRNRVVGVEMKSGAVVEGLWLNSDANSFTLETASSGQTPIARTDIRKAWIRNRRSRGRVIGSLGGYAIGAGIAGAATGSREALQGPLIALPVALAILGFATGRSMDRQPEPLHFQ